MIQNNYQITSYLIKNFSELKSEKFFIHSVFKNTLNLTNKKLLFSISTKNNLSPISISVDDNLFNFLTNYLQENKSIIINYPSIDLNTYKIYLNNFSLINTQIETLNFPGEDSIKIFFSNCINFDKKSNSLINIFKNHYSSNFIYRKFKTLHIRLIDILQEYDLKSYEKFLNHIAGLGIGLTPAGDDFLYGLLATWKTFSIRDDFVSTTERFILNNPDKFNFISFNFLKSLINGDISSVIKRIFYNLSVKGDYMPELSELLNYGHTSGKDTITGILTALQNK